MRVAYDQFHDGKQFKGEMPPERWDTWQLVHSLCSKDITNRDWVLDNVSHKEAEMWLLFGRYYYYSEKVWSEKA